MEMPAYLCLSFNQIQQRIQTWRKNYIVKQHKLNDLLFFPELWIGLTVVSKWRIFKRLVTILKIGCRTNLLHHHTVDSRLGLLKEIEKGGFIQGPKWPTVYHMILSKPTINWAKGMLHGLFTMNCDPDNNI